MRGGSTRLSVCMDVVLQIWQVIMRNALIILLLAGSGLSVLKVKYSDELTEKVEAWHKWNSGKPLNHVRFV